MIVETTPQLMTLDEFLDWYPDGYGRYELHNGVVFEMQPTGTHKQVAGFLALKLGVQIELLELPYIIPRQAIVKPVDTDKSGYNPDVIVLDKSAFKNESLWKKRSTITQGKTVKLIIEVVSTNWRDDYGLNEVRSQKSEVRSYFCNGDLSKTPKKKSP